MQNPLPRGYRRIGALPLPIWCIVLFAFVVAGFLASIPLTLTVGEPKFTPASVAPTAAPTTGTPSVPPTLAPTGVPSVAPTRAPTGVPSFAPTAAPTASPSPKPTPGPSPRPTPKPSPRPSPKPSPAPTPVPTPTAPYCGFFVSSVLYAGNALGGIDGADAKCTLLASLAGLTGTWRAWLGVASAGASPTTRWLRSSIPYRMPPAPSSSIHAIVALNWDDLVNTTTPLITAPTRNEFGTVIGSNYNVWTGASATGAASGPDCGGWSTPGGDALSGRLGSANNVGTLWSSFIVTSANCSATLARIYCGAQNCTGTPAAPSSAPSSAPTVTPSAAPSSAPSTSPTLAPTAAPVGPPTISPLPNSCYVFVTRSNYTGSQLGAGGSLADAVCQAEANATVGALPTVTQTTAWRAWLSNSTLSATNRIAISMSTYRRPDNVAVATNFSYVLDSSLLAPIHVDVTGTHVAPDIGVWTGTGGDGQPTGGDCAGWTSSSAGQAGTYGNEGSTITWSASPFNGSCAVGHRLYCFQGDCTPPPTPGPTGAPTTSPTLAPTGTPTNAPTSATFALGCTVFASSATYTGGQLGGTAGANALCTSLAAASEEPNVANRTTWRAWLSSTSVDDPESTFTVATVPYKLPTGTTLSPSGASFFSQAGLSASIGRDEHGNAVTGYVWTSTGSNGVGPLGTQHCTGWTSSTSSTFGRVGDSTSAADPTWSDAGTALPCDQQARIYCVSQDCATPAPTASPTLPPTASPTLPPTAAPV